MCLQLVYMNNKLSILLYLAPLFCILLYYFLPYYVAGYFIKHLNIKHSKNNTFKIIKFETKLQFHLFILIFV